MAPEQRAYLAGYKDAATKARTIVHRRFLYLSYEIGTSSGDVEYLLKHNATKQETFKVYQELAEEFTLAIQRIEKEYNESAPE